MLPTVTRALPRISSGQSYLFDSVIRSIIRIIFQRPNMNGFSATNSHTCQWCNKSFARRFNLKRHIENAHDEEQESDSDVNEENGSENEIELVDAEDDGSTTDEDDSPSSDVEDNPSFQDFVTVALASNKVMWTEKYEKYRNAGMSEYLARKKATQKTLWAVKRVFFDNYKDFLLSYLHLKENDTHQEIVDDLEDKIDKGFHPSKAVDGVIPATILNSTDCSNKTPKTRTKKTTSHHNIIN